VSVPLGISTPDQPNISSTIWRTVSDQKNLIYYFDSATRPNTFWVSISPSSRIRLRKRRFVDFARCVSI
jgi:penicillin V acylase-like amidase (Ntn superfamily)